MVKVSFSKQSNYAVSAAPIKKKLANFFVKMGIVSDAEVSIAIVGEKRMMELGRKYLKDKKLHNVLSFTPTETKVNFIYPPGGPIHLGEIIVCYHEALREAKDENVLTDEKIYELIEHGAMHLLGIHHQE